MFPVFIEVLIPLQTSESRAIYSEAWILGYALQWPHSHCSDHIPISSYQTCNCLSKTVRDMLSVFSINTCLNSCSFTSFEQNDTAMSVLVCLLRNAASHVQESLRRPSTKEKFFSFLFELYFFFLGALANNSRENAPIILAIFVCP